MKPIAIQSGILYVDDENSPEWTLGSGQGERSIAGVVEFPKPFEVPPYVILSLYDEDEEEYLDLLEESAEIEKEKEEIPVQCKVRGVSEKSFEFVFSTWANHQIHSITARWVAMAQK